MEIIVHAVAAQKLGRAVDPFGEEQISALSFITNAPGNAPQENHQGGAKGAGEDDGEVYRSLSDESRYPQLPKDPACAGGHIIREHLVDCRIGLPELGKACVGQNSDTGLGKVLA
jgi:hypothetical protein